MTIDYDQFRQDVRNFLDREYTPEKRALNMRQAGAHAEPALGMWWHRTLNARGWAAPAWPTEHGGPGWDALQRHIFDSECAAADTPEVPLQGTSLAGPAIMQFGCQAQRDYFLPGILSGDIYFCQGFSEPGSGSDLASLRSSAVRNGDCYAVSGTKIWTTHAQHANWIFLLARTSKEGRPQSGITFLIAPMDSPGITVKPIISISGEHELNQIFFDDVRIPVSNRIGDENDGWAITKYLLEFERGGSYAARISGLLGRDQMTAREQPGDDGRSLWQDSSFRRRIADLEIAAIALAATEDNVASSQAAGQNVGGVTAAILKITGSELMQQATECCMDALGDYAFADQRQSLVLASDIPPIGPDFAAKPVAKYLNARAWSIAGGANEVLRNVIARAAMNLK